MNAPVVNIDFFVGGNTLTAEVISELLGGSASGIVETLLTTAGNGTLTAAALVGGQITRTGPSANFTDTLDNGADIVAALGENIEDGQTFIIRYKNKTQYVCTLASPGASVVLPATIVVPPLSIGWYFATVSGTEAAPVVTLKHTATSFLHVPSYLSDPQTSSVTTVGAGTILVGNVNAGTTLRSGAQVAAFTDTLDSAANIIAGVFGLSEIGAAVKWKYINNTAGANGFPATIAGPDGNVVVSGASVVPANAWVEYLITRTGAGTVSFVAIAQGYFPKVGTTAAANGATPVAVADTRVTPNSIITLTFNTLGGTAHGAFVSSKTGGTGFSIESLAGDTSTYDYKIEG